MTKQNFKFIISFESVPVEFQEYLKQQHPFYEKITEKNPKLLTFEELIKIVPIKEQRFIIQGIEFSDMEYDGDENDIKTTIIEIRGHEF